MPSSRRSSSSSAVALTVPRFARVMQKVIAVSQVAPDKLGALEIIIDMVLDDRSAPAPPDAKQ